MVASLWLLWSAGVGALWGATNPLIARGSTQAAAEQRTGGSGCGLAGFWAALLRTPAFWVPQLANWAGSAAFVFGLARGADLSTAPLVANCTALIVNALADSHLEGHSLDWRFTAPGLLFVAAGVYLCAS
mmetsp:Transcript_28156/g.70654  ORF Transcript_28156/g.70654 Transcript_28156/m.70654 type:complete len:130 (+) Transcript_28156:101-490(+)